MTVAELRAAFADGPSVDLAAAVGGPVTPWTPARKVSAITRCYADDDRLAVVVGAFETQAHVDQGLAYGLALAGDRDLMLVLPHGSEEPTLRRAAWISVPLEVWTHDGTAATPCLIPSRPEVLASYTDQLVTTDHQLGDAAAHVERLVDWAAANPVLTPAHRKGYLAWHCAGRLVLRVARTKGGVDIRAGVQYSSPTADQPAPVRVWVEDPMTPVQEHRVLAAAARAIADRLDGIDTGHAEHRLQAALHAHPRRLGLLPRPFLREFPAIRPTNNRGFIDYLGVDTANRIHVGETKIGADAMLVLQGLDYWIWAAAHVEELSAHLGAGSDPPAMDFVVASKNGQPAIGPYTAAQAEALDGSIPWRVHTVTGWDDVDLDVTSAPSRTVPPGPRHAGPRYASRLQTHLHSHHGTMFLADASAGVVESARWGRG